MNGRYTVRVSDSRVKYSFELIRNITVVQGNSGTGKTTLFDMISAYARLKDRSGVQLSCERPCVALTADADWQSRLAALADSIVFIDEDADYVNTHEFASAIRANGNYYVIFSREPLHELPYSVDEVYVIKTSGKYHSFQKLYRRQSGCVYAKAAGRERATVVLTEDSGSGFQFYRQLYDGTAVRCESALSNSGIFGWLKAHHEQKVFVIADGAAFGSEMNRIMEMQRQFPDKITVCLPESFEWLILCSGLISAPGLSEVLADPSHSIECRQFFSWENFFTDYLIKHTAGMYSAYSKSRLNSFYTVSENSGRIVALLAASMPERQTQK